jgi:hypothetical protein
VDHEYARQGPRLRIASAELPVALPVVGCMTCVRLEGSTSRRTRHAERWVEPHRRLWLGEAPPLPIRNILTK